MNHTPPPIIENYDYHKYVDRKLTLNIICGGGTDINGITWMRKGQYWAYPDEDSTVLEEKYGYWWPTVNPESMVSIDGAIKIDKSYFKHPGSRNEYDRLLNISKIKYIKKDRIMDKGSLVQYGSVYVTREFNNP